MIQRTLGSFYGSFYGRTDGLLRDFLMVSPSPVVGVDSLQTDRLLGYSRGFLVNRLLHLWGEFCRGVVMASALGGYRTLSGVLLANAPQIASLPDILTAIGRSSMTGPGLRWGDPVWTAQKVRTIQPANVHQITLGIGTAPYTNFAKVRNFVVHSNPHTRSQFDSVAFAYSLIGVSADDLLLHRLPGGGTVMESWVRDFQYAALNAVR